MPGIVKIKPNFNRIQSAVAFPTRELNYLLEEQVYDGFSFYQNRFNVYSFMRLTKDLKHRIHTMTSIPMIWQPHNSCYIDPLGNIRMGEQEMSPCKGTAVSEFCYDELFDSCFRHFLQWDGQGPLEFDEQGVAMFNRLVGKILESMILGARLTLTANGLYTNDMVEFKDSVDKDIRNLFMKTSHTCQGWMAYLKQLAQQNEYSHLNINGIINEDDFNGKKFEGDIEAVLDNLIDNALPDMKGVLDEGGLSSLQGGSIQPMFLLTSHLFAAIADAYRRQCNTVYCTNPRLTQEMETFNNSRVKVYYFDDIPIIPIHDVNYYDKYLKNATHFAGLTVSGNINLGASFADIPTLDNRSVGVRIKMKDENENYGIYSFRSDSLFSTMIADTDYMVATCVQTKEV
jgi:hypothetical protein